LSAPPDRPLLLVEWLDSAQPMPGWRFLDDTPPLDVVRCVSVGWLVAKSDQVWMLAPNLGCCGEGEDTQASGFIRIPALAVVRSVSLLEAEA
jgi:hypothetical protein